MVMDASRSRKRILVTGGAGFIGSHVVIHLVKNYPQYYIVNLDVLDYCSCLWNVHSAISSCRCEQDVNLNEKTKPKPKTTTFQADFQEETKGDQRFSKVGDECLSAAVLAHLPSNYKFIHGSITNAELIGYLLEHEQIDTILHFAAQSHVDHSFGNSLKFTTTNILGTHVLLEAAKGHPIEKFIYVSTDEVYGEAESDSTPRAETHGFLPTNPYAATKAAAELLVQTFQQSFRLPVIITRSNNVYGPHQYPEKLIPKAVNQIFRHRPVTIHGTGHHTRTYLFISDVVAAFDLILHQGEIGQVYNIGGTNERTNQQVALDLLALIKPELHGTELAKYLEYVPDRPFNDQRYVIDSTKLRQLGWKETVSWEQGLRITIEWIARFGHCFHDIDHALEAHPTTGKNGYRQ